MSLHPEQFSVVALTANKNVDVMFAQCQQYQPQTVVMADVDSAKVLSDKLINNGLNQIEVSGGAGSVSDIASDAASDTVMSAIVGAAGLIPTLNAVRAAKRVLIANKEPLVMTGSLFMQEAVSYTHLTLPTIYSV